MQLPVKTKKPHYPKSTIVSSSFDWGPIQVNLYGLYQAIRALRTGASLCYASWCPEAVVICTITAKSVVKPRFVNISISIHTQCICQILISFVFVFVVFHTKYLRLSNKIQHNTKATWLNTRGVTIHRYGSIHRYDVWRYDATRKISISVV